MEIAPLKFPGKKDVFFPKMTHEIRNFSKTIISE